MIDEKMIPDEVVEAGAKRRYERTNPDLKWEDCAYYMGGDVHQRKLFNARQDIAAALAAWPGLDIIRSREVSGQIQIAMLPLTKEGR